MTVWVSTIQEKGDSYTRGELVKQLEAGDVVNVEIHPNAQVPTGSLDVYLKGGYVKTLYVSDLDGTLLPMDQNQFLELYITSLYECSGRKTRN